MPKVLHYREKCIGCNSCVEYAPHFWKISALDGKSNLINAVGKKKIYQREISLVEVNDISKAAEYCPVKIIKIIK
ncbi:MAG: hypothetical protein A3A02_00395 [Candidatus Buchananbacteria bacterium RIFCSPLOWO2_01_FULL_39_33]|uniref:4Fe-4S ferredoxin-type domain-containing protein n=1 Tax=Candidatus Buchananbacteria bacterium RIFCSPLOWO2_01_FULL_39_33 TaxID=1797543 RepID=A0A1G1YHS6_9BACT|nr:ferredoxin [Candidatus Woesearchaeota archaeon]OGY51882.1 MAG: hypothetical protein A3A02_00395 [Candidatus Buchananbacteria bacterium RIFCSPLOWO2_01_FULL_39_33]